MSKVHRRCQLLGVLVVVLLTSFAGAVERRWQLLLDGIFRGGTKPLYIYARNRDGRWITGVGSSRDPDREGGKTYNRSWYLTDLSGVPIVDGAMKGQFRLYVTPDLWIPRDHKPFTMEFEIDAKLDGSDRLAGRYEITKINTEDESVKGFGRSGKVTGTCSQYNQPKMPRRTGRADDEWRRPGPSNIHDTY